MIREIRLFIFLTAALAACRREPPPSAPALSPREKDRAELTLQSRRGWTPEDAPRKLTMLLVSEKTSIRKGEGFRYRLEIRNVGREPVAFEEPAPSFIKDGSLCGSRGYRFYATPPREAERLLPCEPETGAAADSGLDLTLRPGDYLLTRRDGPASPFRTLRTKFRFDTLGTYRVRAVYSAAKLRAVSNPVAMTVVP